MTVPLRIIKLGGSLLAWPGVREALREWRQRQPQAVDLLVGGGGPAADWIRQADATHRLGDDAAHRLAIQAMQLNAHLAETLWPESLPVASLDSPARRSIPPGLWVFQPWPALADAEQAKYGQPLPHAWHVTSDSIAAWIARATEADELALLKSSLPANSSISACAVAGYVDRYFPAAATDVRRIRAVGLRSANFDERPLDQ